VTALDRYTEELTLAVRSPIVNKGGVTSLVLTPRVHGEHMIVSSTTIAVAQQGGNTEVAQVFRAVRSKFHSVGVRVGAETSPVHLEDFESYADTAALKVAWVVSDAVNTDITLEEVIPGADTKSMSIDVSKNKSALDTVTNTFGAEDWSAVTDIGLLIRQDQPTTLNQVRIRIGDGVNTMSILVPVNAVDTWESRVISLTSFENDGVGDVDLSVVTTIEFEVESDGENGVILIDNVRAVGPPGTMTVAIHEVASEDPAALGALVVSAQVTLANVDDAFYLVDLSADLTVGQYYAVVLNAPDIATTALNVLGGTGYDAGDAYTSTDDGATLTRLVDTDMFFLTYWRSAGVVSMFSVDFDAEPGNGDIEIAIVNFTTGRIQRYLCHKLTMLSGLLRDHALRDETIREDEVVVLFLEDDVTSPASVVALTVEFSHEPINTAG
jgi:hypothetical protein